ncbi:MAG: nucleotide sugar dehydrogenase [Dehalococcoidia bacterium]|nr:nucleotide sugar dehydrogenase [Dehalococcoidia bacterium]
MKSICVLGLGYIGLPTASMFAMHGHTVVGVDVNEHVVWELNHGNVHLQEPGLKNCVQAALQSGSMVVSSRPEPCDAFIIAVPTPLLDDRSSDNGIEPGRSRRADLSYVRSATEAVLPFLRAGNLVILESTSPPGTAEKLVVPILERSGLKVGRDLFVAHCPERVLPGSILEELVHNDRIIGGVDRASAELARSFYSCFVKGQIILTDATTAELVKLMENTYRDVNIAMANEFALVAEHNGIDVWEAIDLANRHPRVNILKPGPGVGGHCIAVDPWFIVESAPEVTPLIQASRNVNEGMPARVVELVKQAVSASGKVTIACLGLAYKADVDDIRESPAVEVVRLLQVDGFQVRAYDPHVECGKVTGQVNSLEEALENAEAIVLLTDHREFRELRPDQLGNLPAVTVIDTRRTIADEAWILAGLEVWRLGTGRVIREVTAAGNEAGLAEVDRKAQALWRAI